MQMWLLHYLTHINGCYSLHAKVQMLMNKLSFTVCTLTTVTKAFMQVNAKWQLINSGAQGADEPKQLRFFLSYQKALRCRTW